MSKPLSSKIQQLEATKETYEGLSELSKLTGKAYDNSKEEMILAFMNIAISEIKDLANCFHEISSYHYNLNLTVQQHDDKIVDIAKDLERMDLERKE